MSLLSVADILDPNPIQDISEWTKDKRGHTHNGEGGFLWSKQREIGESVSRNRFTTVRSAHGTGKSWLAADIVAWWLDQHPIGDAFAVTTAPSAPQVEGILWREISVAHTDAKLAGRITWGQVPAWKYGDQMIAYGRKPADYTDHNKAMAAFQGIHAAYVLVILDEACGIPEWLWNAVDTIVTNDDSRVLAIGNPDDPASHFEQTHRPGSGWHSIKISAFDLPWATGEVVPDYLHKVLTGEKWVEERKKKWGEGSPLYQAKVLGEFPDLSDDSLITPKWVRAAQENYIAGLSLGQAGGDVARLGQDWSALYHNIDGVIRKVDAWAKRDTMYTAGQYAKFCRENANSVPLWVDISGLGAGVYDRLREQGLLVYPFDGGQKANDNVRFKNRRAEQYWILRGMFEKGLVDLDPEDDELANELMAIKWSLTSRGQIVIESKEDMRKRGVPSPNHADAAMMSIREPVYIPTQTPQAADLTSDLLDKPM